MDEESLRYMKGAVEALLFISEKPVALEQFKEALETVEIQDIRFILKELQQDYEERQTGITLVEIAGGFQMLSNPQYAEYIRNFFKTRVKEKLSRPALEVLAIAAYRQPVSRGDIEMIRGVNSDGTVAHLLDKNLIKIVGRKDVPGRPYLYGTTKLFLEYFGLKSLKDLPKLEDFVDSVGAMEDERGAGNLFSSNKPVTVEDAVQDVGEDHVERSFATQDPGGESVPEDEVLSSSEPAPEEFSDAMARRDIAQQEHVLDGPAEEAGDLKKAMDAISRGEHETEQDAQRPEGYEQSFYEEMQQEQAPEPSKD